MLSIYFSITPIEKSCINTRSLPWHVFHARCKWRKKLCSKTEPSHFDTSVDALTRMLIQENNSEFQIGCSLASSPYDFPWENAGRVSIIYNERVFLTSQLSTKICLTKCLWSGRKHEKIGAKSGYFHCSAISVHLKSLLQYDLFWIIKLHVKALGQTNTGSLMYTIKSAQLPLSL